MALQRCHLQKIDDTSRPQARMETFAVISDVHGNLTALEAVLGSLEDIDLIYVLGDLVGIGPQPSEVLDMIMGDRRFQCVMGNHDHNTVHGTELGPTGIVPRRPHHDWVRSQLSEGQVDFLGGLPMVRSVNTPSGRAVMMHRHPQDCGSRVPYFPSPTADLLDGFYSDVGGDALFFGHTHSHLVMRGASGRLYVNPGAVGAENGGSASFVTVSGDLEVERVQVPYDIGSVRNMISGIALPYHQFIISNFFRS